MNIQKGNRLEYKNEDPIGLEFEKVKIAYEGAEQAN